MIQEIIAGAINPRITSDLAWISRLGGLVVPLSGRDGDRDITVPAAANDGVDCFQNGTYAQYLPDSALAALAYWERIGSTLEAVNPLIPKGRGVTVTESLRFVVWCNLERLTVTPGNEWHLVQAARSVLLALARFSITTPIKTTVRISVVDIERDPLVIFGQYTHATEARWFRLPYFAFAISVAVQWLQMQPCPEEFAINVKQAPC